MSSSSEEGFVGDEDSDDEPLSKLKVNGKKSKQEPVNEESEEGEDQDDDDDDDAWEDEGEEPASSKKRKSEEVDDDSDEDDIPLASLASSKKPKNGDKKVVAASKKKKVAKTASVTKTKAKTPTKKESSSDYQSASAALYGSECQKGLLIQRLLCRWWFGIVWPDPSTLPAKPPANYDALDGFPGVYVCTKGDDVGKILDMRNMDQCPNFKNFAKKSSKELQELLITAIENQKKELIKVDGKGTSTEDELNDLLRWANKVQPSQADKEAVKVLKAAGLKLD